MGGDDEASYCSSRRAGNEADARPAHRAPQQPAVPSGLEEAEVEMGFEASKAPMHALEADFGDRNGLGILSNRRKASNAQSQCGTMRGMACGISVRTSVMGP